MSDRSNPMKDRKTALSSISLSAAAVFTLGILIGVPAQSANVVPWVNQPATERAAATPAPAAQRPCAASDLQIVLGGAGAYRGKATQEIQFTNRSTDKCYLIDAPNLQLLPRGETARTVDPSTLGAERVELSPGERTIVLIGTPGTCDAAVNPERKVITRLNVAPLGGGSVTLDGAHVDTSCGPASVVWFQGVDTDAVAAASASPLSQLVGTLNVPQVATRGDTLRYTVTLANPTGKAISLSPCPAYSQSLNAEGKTSSQTLRLNCDAAGGQIPAKSSVTFEMQAPVPADMPGIGVKLSWELEDGPTVGTIIALR